MIKVFAVAIVCMVSLTGFIAVKHDLAVKKEAKSVMIDLCSNYENIDKNTIRRAIETFEEAKTNVRLLNTDQEEKAKSIVEHSKFFIELAEEGVKTAEGLVKKDDSDFSKELSRKHIEEKKQELNNYKKELSEKMKIVLASYN
jgi:hypothetical protein